MPTDTSTLPIIDRLYENVKNYVEELAIGAHQDPVNFVVKLLLVLTPFILISTFLSWKLMKLIEAQERKDNAHARRLEEIKSATGIKKSDVKNRNKSKKTD